MRIIPSLLLIGAFTASAAQAQSYLNPKPERYSYDDRLRVELNFFYGGYDTKLRLDNEALVARPNPIYGTEVSGEDDFGLAKSQLLNSVELTLLPRKHHLVRFNALTMRRDGERVLTREVLWDNDSYHVGERVDSHLNVSLYGLTYGYLPFRTDRFELGLDFGISIGTISANAEVRSKVIRESESGGGPVPLVGLEGRFDISRRWSVEGRYQYFSAQWLEVFGVKLKDREATISDGRIAIRWRQNPHFLYGLGYRFFNLDALSPHTDPIAKFSMGLTGPLLYVQASL